MSVSEEKISSIDRALDILILFHTEGKELGVTEIGSALGLYKSTVYRTLATLEKRGFVQQNTENGKYWLGIKIYALGMAVGEKMHLKRIIQPYAKRLSEKFNEVVNVSVLDTTSEKFPRSVLILKEEIPSQVLKMTPGIGSSNICYNSATGKVLLAFSPKETSERCKEEEIIQSTEKTIKSWDKLFNEIECIRAKGYAIDNEEQEIGLTCIAAPILDRNKMIVAAISLSGPTSRVNSRDFEEIVNEVKKVAAEVSELLK